jgi:hypothetical protein
MDSLENEKRMRRYPLRAGIQHKTKIQQHGKGDMKMYSEAKTVAVAIAAAVSSVAALCFLMATAGAAFAQGADRRPTPVERRTEFMNLQSEEYDLEKASRDLKGRPEKPSDRRRAQEIEEQIKHDFEGLQESHNQIVLVMAAKEGLNRQRDFVFRAVAEIKKYSTRLKTNLALPKPQQERARVEVSNEQIEESLMTLRKHIYDFVTNPLFESQGVLDLEQGRKASRDLDRIIELSESITKSGDTLKKPTKP